MRQGWREPPCRRGTGDGGGAQGSATGQAGGRPRRIRRWAVAYRAAQPARRVPRRVGPATAGGHHQPAQARRWAAAWRRGSGHGPWSSGRRVAPAHLRWSGTVRRARHARTVRRGRRGRPTPGLPRPAPPGWAMLQSTATPRPPGWPTASAGHDPDGSTAQRQPANWLAPLRGDECAAHASWWPSGYRRPTSGTPPQIKERAGRSATPRAA